MPIGRPDWSSTGKSDNVATTNDTGELAVRLGSAINFDRTGKVLFATDFPSLNNFLWVAIGTLTQKPHITSSKFYYGVSSLHAISAAGNTNGLQVSYKGRTWANSKLSFEYGIYTDFLPSQMILNIVRYLPGIRRYFSIQFVNSMSDIQVMQADGTYVKFVDTSASQWPQSMFNDIKLDFDLETNTYTRFRLNSNTYDLSAYGTFTDASSTADYIEANLYIYSPITLPLNIYLDHFSYTEDE